jgi:hypothetical protein
MIAPGSNVAGVFRRTYKADIERQHCARVVHSSPIEFSKPPTAMESGNVG